MESTDIDVSTNTVKVKTGLSSDVVLEQIKKTGKVCMLVRVCMCVSVCVRICMCLCLCLCLCLCGAAAGCSVD